MFLTGQRNSMDNLVEKGKEYTAINNIISKMKHEEKLSETDPQYQQALDLFSKVNLELVSNLREAFVTLYYPKRRGLVSDDITMEFEENKYDVEDQIKSLLINQMKFDVEIESKEFRDKFEDRIFTQRQMNWNAIKERAAITTSWSWHHPNALEDLKDDMLRREEWIETGGYIDKEPPAPETSLMVRQVNEDESTGEVTLRINSHNGDTVFYDIGQDATTSSLKLKDLNNFTTKELKLSFLCVDSKGKNPTGSPVNWIRDVKVKHRPYDKDGEQYMELIATADNVKILYTTDGSNPRDSGGVFEEDFVIPQETKYIQAVAVNEKLGVYSEPVTIEVTERKFEIDRTKELKIVEPTMYNSTAETFNGLEELQQFNTSLSGLNLAISNHKDHMTMEFAELSLGGFDIEDPKTILQQLNSLIDNFFSGKEFEVNLSINEITFET